MWLRKGNHDNIEYFSIKKLQIQAGLERKKLGLKNPLIHNMSKCFNCNRLFNSNDVFTFYSDEYDEYCKHVECPSKKYYFEVKGLELAELQIAINHGNINYEGDTVIPSSIEKIYLNNDIQQELDLSKTELKEIDVANYTILNLDAFKTVKILKCSNTLIDFTKFTNIIKLTLTNINYNVDLSPCKSLVRARMEKITNSITIDGCDKLSSLELSNIDSQITLNCPNLQMLELYCVSSKIDLSKCNISRLEIVEGSCNLEPSILPSINFLYTCNPRCNIDVIQFPNITTLIHKITNVTVYDIININKLNNLKIYEFTNYLSYIESNDYNFDFRLNHLLEKVSICAPFCECSVVFGDNLKLKECNLEFRTNCIINIPKNVSVKQLKYSIIN